MGLVSQLLTVTCPVLLLQFCIRATEASAASRLKTYWDFSAGDQGPGRTLVAAGLPRSLTNLQAWENTLRSDGQRAVRKLWETAGGPTGSTTPVGTGAIASASATAFASGTGASAFAFASASASGGGASAYASAYASAFGSGSATAIASAFAYVTSPAEAYAYATASASAYVAAGSPKSTTSPFATAYASAFAEVSGAPFVPFAQVDASAAVLITSLVGGSSGPSFSAIATAAATAFVSGQSSQGANAFAKAFAVAIANLGCNQMRSLLLEAQAIATSEGLGSAFAQGIATAYIQSLTLCLNGNEAAADAAAKAEATALGATNLS